MDTTTETTVPTAEAPRTMSVVKLFVCHGEYRETFYGNGTSDIAAAMNAAAQSSYSSGLFDSADRFYETRATHRAALAQALKSGEVYRGFGWCDFSKVA